MRVRTICAAILLAAVGCAEEPPTDVVVAPRENGRLVFAALSDEGMNLFAVNEDGSDLRRLTVDGESLKTAIAASPDGRRLAYAHTSATLPGGLETATTSLTVLDADGSNARTLCHGCAATLFVIGEGDLIGMVDALAWSPDGSTLAAPAPEHGVLLFDVESGEGRRIDTPRQITAIAWSPEGTGLVLSHTRILTPVSVLGEAVPGQPPDAVGGMYRVDIDTGHLEEVAVQTGGLAHVHGWSPQGAIAFTHLDGDRGQAISAWSVEDERSWPLIPGDRGADDLGARWSPAGDRFAALIQQHDEESRSAMDLRVVPAGGGAPIGLPVCAFEGAFEGDGCIRAPIAWSPDGTSVAYRAVLQGTPTRSAIVVQAIEGGSNEVIPVDGASFDLGLNPCCLLWLPAS